MSRRALVPFVLVLLVGLAGCQGARRSPSGFRLPPGDAAAGKQAFVDLKCYTCHSVKGEEMPAATAAQVIELGGNKVLPPTDGDITTDIIMPSSHFASEWKGEGRSPMPDYTRTMT
ncbi:MAG: cytochrome, partial [Acidobacteria bacterium]|nr:cytochrome [Acidobacteriota bacterium]